MPISLIDVRDAHHIGLVGLCENRPSSRALGIRDEGLRHGLVLGITECCHARQPATGRAEKILGVSSKGKKIAARGECDHPPTDHPLAADR